MAPTNSAVIHVPCDSPDCPNYLTAQQDDYIPDPWICPQCQDRALEQQIEELSHAPTTEQEHPR